MGKAFAFPAFAERREPSILMVGKIKVALCASRTERVFAVLLEEMGPDVAETLVSPSNTVTRMVVASGCSFALVKFCLKVKLCPVTKP